MTLALRSCQRITTVPRQEDRPDYFARITVSPTSMSKNVGDTPVPLVVHGLSREGIVLELDPAELSFSSDTPGTAAVDAAGTVSFPGGSGAAVLTVEHDPSGYTATVTADVAAGATFVDEVLLSPSVDQPMLAGGTPVLFEATPRSSGVEVPLPSIEWHLVNDDGTASVDDTVGPTYKHANLVPLVAGNEQVFARAVGAGVGGIDIDSDPVDLVVAADITGFPNQPVDINTLVIDKTMDILPPATGVAADGFRRHSGSLLNLTLVHAPDYPAGHQIAMRGYHPPNTKGGASPFAYGFIFNAAPFSLTATQLKALYFYILGSVSAFFFIPVQTGWKRFWTSQLNGLNSFFNLMSKLFGNTMTYTRQAGSNSGHTWAAKNYGTSMNMLPPNRGRPLIEEIELRGNNTNDTEDGLYRYWVDAAERTPAGGRAIMIHGDQTKAFSDRWNHSPTQGGGHTPPSGVEGVGASGGRFSRTGDDAGIPGTVGGTGNKTFTRLSGTFNLPTPAVSGDDSIFYWSFMRSSDGAVIRKSEDISNTSPTTLTTDSVSLAGADVVYRGHEPFQASDIGKVMFFRGSVANRLVEIYRSSSNKGSISGTPYTGTAAGLVFTKTSGVFPQAGVDDQSWAFRDPSDGRIVGPIFVPKENIVGGALTIPAGVYPGGSIVGCTEAYQLGFPLIAAAAITGFDSVTTINDTVEVDPAVDLTGAAFAFGIIDGQTEPPWEQIARFVVKRKP